MRGGNLNKETCEKCGKEYGVGEWWLCPHGFPRYGWHFKQGQNDARREQFFKDARENPFGNVSA